MQRAIIGLVDGEPPLGETSIDRVRTGGSFAIEPEELTYLDGETLTTGRATGTIDTQQTEIHVLDDAIVTEELEGRERVLTEFYADLEAPKPFVTVDRGDGEFLWEQLGGKIGADIERARLDLDAWARDLEAEENASVWQVGWNRDYGEDDDEQGVGVQFHRDASLREHRSEGGITQLGFQYRWDGAYIRGTAAESGYVAVFSTLADPTWGRWLREEILPLAELHEEETEQDTLGGEN